MKNLLVALILCISISVCPGAMGNGLPHPSSAFSTLHPRSTIQERLQSILHHPTASILDSVFRQMQRISSRGASGAGPNILGVGAVSPTVAARTMGAKYGKKGVARTMDSLKQWMEGVVKKAHVVASPLARMGSGGQNHITALRSVDTAIVYGFFDTTRTLFSSNEAGWWTCKVTQRLWWGTWTDIERDSIIVSSDGLDVVSMSDRVDGPMTRIEFRFEPSGYLVNETYRECYRDGSVVGGSSIYSYDAKGRIEKALYMDESGYSYTTSYKYDAWGNIIYYRCEDTFNGRRGVSAHEYRFDEAGRRQTRPSLHRVLPFNHPTSMILRHTAMIRPGMSSSLRKIRWGIKDGYPFGDHSGRSIL